MKKIIKYIAALGVVSFILGLIVSVAENWKEKSRKRKNWKEKNQEGRIWEGEENPREEENGHCCYGSYEKYFKRPLDFAMALFALVFLSPVLAVVAVLVRIKLGSPVIFSQERPGKDGRIFRLYKFRTMTEEKGSDGKLLPDGERLTDFGKKLRATSLDELPEFFNILKGDMALVGPRPLLVEYLPRYNARQMRRHDVRPGLTGLAQVSGRNSLSWEEKFEDDVGYVKKITFMGDIKILARTFLVVFKGTGISSGASVTMEEFRGSE